MSAVVIRPAKPDDAPGIAACVCEASSVAFARSTMSVIVGSGAPKPDISSGEALKRLLLSARSITYGNPAGGGAAGIVVSGMLQQLQIADKISSKAILAKDGREVAALVAMGGAEVGMTQTSMALSRGDVTYVGTLPKEALKSQAWGAGACSIGIVSQANAPDAARSLVSFMSSATAVQRLRASRMEP